MALTRGELLVIYLMMLVGGPISNREGIGYLVCHPVIPYYFSTQETQWAETFHQYLPRWFGPSDRQVVRGFFEGRQDVPWGAWAAPMLAWGAFYVALFGTMFCFNALVEKQWIDRERLTFPLLYIPLELTRNVGAPEGGERHGVRSLLYQRGFWMGVAIPFIIGSFNALHRYLPTVPQIPLQFPLHPVGFMSAHSWGMHLNWFPFLLGWAAKVSLVRYGGLTIYRRTLPFFVGLLIGSTLSSGVWGLVGWAVGKPMEI